MPQVRSDHNIYTEHYQIHFVYILQKIFSKINRYSCNAQTISNCDQKKILDQCQPYIIASVILADRQIFSALALLLHGKFCHNLNLLFVDHILLLTIIVTVHSNLFKPYFLKIPEIIIHRLIVSYIPNHEKYFFRFRPTFVQRCTHSDVSRTQSYKKYGFRSIFQQTFCHGFHCTPCRIHIIDHKNSQACYRPCCLKRISEIFLSLFSVQFFL